MKPQVTSPELEVLNAHLVDLNAELQLIRELFTPENVVLFYRVAPMFFHELQERLTIHLIQSIGRLFDPEKTSGQLNLSLDAIAALPEVAPISADLKRRIAAVRPLWAKHMKVWRHKRIAHSDAATATGRKDLPELPWQDVREIVVQVSDIGREIHHQLNGVHHSYEPRYGKGWVPDLLKVLKAGVEKQDADRAAALGREI